MVAATNPPASPTAITPTAATAGATPTAAGAEPPLELELWSRDLGREHGFEPLRVEGTLPAQLRGTLYRNGPALFSSFGTKYAHPFEGDGAITAIRIADGKAQGASQVTQTRGLVEERRRGKMLYGLSAPWHRRIRSMLTGRDKNAANTNVILWQDRLFALNEGGKPTELAAGSLAMVGETDLGGVVTGAFSAHPHRVESRKTLYNFGLEYGRRTRLHAYALPDTGPARELGVVELGGATMLHDFIATETHLVWFVSPVRIDVPRMLLQLGSFKTLFKWQPELGVDVIAMPIDRPTDVVRFTTDTFFQWHFANAFTRSATELVIDYVRYPNFGSFGTIGGHAQGAGGAAFERGRYHRATLDLAAKTLQSELLADRECEFPTVAPAVKGAEHAVAYATFDGLRAIGSIDGRGRISAHELPASERISEPLYADGHLLALGHAHDRAFVAVYDAARIPDGPVARIWIDHHVPITFHGLYAPA